MSFIIMSITGELRRIMTAGLPIHNVSFSHVSMKQGLFKVECQPLGHYKLQQWLTLFKISGVEMNFLSLQNDYCVSFYKNTSWFL